MIDLGSHENDSLDQLRVLEFHSPIEGRAIHLWHAEVGEDQIVDVGANSLEGGMPIGDHIDLAISVTSYRSGHELAKEGIVVNYENARPLEASRMNVTVRPAVARFTVRNTLTTDRAERKTLTRHR